MVCPERIDGRRINRISLGLAPVTRNRFSEKFPDEKRFPNRFLPERLAVREVVVWASKVDKPAEQ